MGRPRNEVLKGGQGLQRETDRYRTGTGIAYEFWRNGSFDDGNRTRTLGRTNEGEETYKREAGEGPTEKSTIEVEGREDCD